MEYQTAQLTSSIRNYPIVAHRDGALDRVDSVSVVIFHWYLTGKYILKNTLIFVKELLYTESSQRSM